MRIDIDKVTDILHEPAAAGPQCWRTVRELLLPAASSTPLTKG